MFTGEMASDHASKWNLVIIYTLPLTCLIVQANDFNIKYGTPTVALNDDTLREEAYWNASHTTFYLSLDSYECFLDDLKA